MTSFIAAGGSGRSTNFIPAVPAARSVTTIAFIDFICAVTMDCLDDSIAEVRLGFAAGVDEIAFESSGAVSPDPQVSAIPLCDRFNCGRARFEHAEPEAAIRLGLPATHEKAFLDDPTVPDRVKPDLIEVDAFLALWRDIQLEANDELIPVHIRTLDLKIMNFVVRVPPLGFSFHRLAPLEFCHIAGHRLTAHDVVGPEFLTGGL
jgi:hypothetical protein